jgi:hypothetical protein
VCTCASVPSSPIAQSPRPEYADVLCQYEWFFSSEIGVSTSNLTKSFSRAAAATGPISEAHVPYWAELLYVFIDIA